jgi:hypothetical protein
MPDIRANSFNELLDQLYADTWQAPLGRFRSSFAYRGTTSINDDLMTTLRRLGGNYADHEGHLLRNFRKYASRDSVPGDSQWNWLAVAQHHGLPTRLLDWSFSPFVAMHFATQLVEAYDTDGAIWMINYVQAHKDLPQPLRKRLEREQADVFTADMLSEVAPTLPQFDHLAHKDPFLIFFDPPSLDQRIVNQFALLSCMSSAMADISDWLAAHEDHWRRIIIPAAMKWEVRDKLDQANISERVLFPGLDGLCMWLRRYYSPRK